MNIVVSEPGRSMLAEPKMNNHIADGWFMEKSKLWPGQAMSLEVEQVLYHERSKYQDVLVFKRYV